MAFFLRECGLVRHAERGIGNYSVKSKEDIPQALEALKDRPLFAEKWAHFKMVRRPT